MKKVNVSTLTAKELDGIVSNAKNVFSAIQEIKQPLSLNQVRHHVSHLLGAVNWKSVSSAVQVEKTKAEYEFYLCELTENIDGYETRDSFLLQSTDDKIDEKLEQVCLFWRGDEDAVIDEFSGRIETSCSIVSDWSYRKVPSDEVEIVKKYIPLIQ